MPFRKNGDINFYDFDSLDSGVIHAVFSRRGGVSPEPWAHSRRSVRSDESSNVPNARRSVASAGAVVNVVSLGVRWLGPAVSRWLSR